MTETGSTAGDRTGPVLTTKQAAEYVGLKPQTLRVMKCEGTGPQSFKHGRLNVYYPDDLDTWLRSRLVPDTRTSRSAASPQNPPPCPTTDNM